jgi:uncharacterized protein with HEPN domain
MTNETRQRLLDALLSCEAIQQYTMGLDFAAYERDDMVRDAVERRLGIIGEALNRAADLEPELAVQVPDLRSVVGLRNRVIHAYDAVDNEIVWDIVQTKLPRLQASVAELLGDGEDSAQ